MNNTARDCRQLMLSAFHCVNDLEADDWNVLKVQFNYEYFECGGTSSINSRTRTGVTPLTDSNDMPGGNNTEVILSSVKSIKPFQTTGNPSTRAGMRADTTARLESASTTPTATARKSRPTRRL